MTDLLNPLELAPILLMLAEVVVTFVLSRKKIKNRMRLVLGAYLLLIAIATAFRFIVRDEFGFSLIPLIIITSPLGAVLVAPLPIFASLCLGVPLNCGILYLIDRVSYPKHSSSLSGPHAA